MQAPFSKIDEIAQLEHENNLLKVREWVQHFKENPEFRDRFLYWCGDQGHLDEFHELFIEDPVDAIDGTSELPPMLDESTSS